MLAMIYAGVCLELGELLPTEPFLKLAFMDLFCYWRIAATELISTAPDLKSNVYFSIWRAVSIV